MFRIQYTVLQNIRIIDLFNAVKCFVFNLADFDTYSELSGGKGDGSWQDWNPLREDYGSEEQLYRNVDIFDDASDDYLTFRKDAKEKDSKAPDSAKPSFNENDVLPTSKLPKTLPYGKLSKNS